ncbi:MAG: hypothetical protein HY749_15990 [Gammaproteobacteria bacterium]|nr:hypothetical protein [Gammaproteobacteria bacterium]
MKVFRARRIGCDDHAFEVVVTKADAIAFARRAVEITWRNEAMCISGDAKLMTVDEILDVARREME